MNVHFEDAEGYKKTLDCDEVKEGENGIYLIKTPGRDQVGYVPYDRLYYVESHNSENQSA